MSTKPATALKTATERFTNQRIVAIVGNQESGKTVFGTLLKDSIYTHLLPKHKDEFSFNLISGNDILEETEQSIFTDKVFPPPSRPRMESELVFEIARTESLGKKIIVQVRDISGEDFKLAFLGTDIPAETRTTNVLNLKKEKEAIGPFSYLIFAKLYVIMIDCSEFDYWKTLQTRQSQMLNSMLSFKRVIEEVNDDKFSTPLAIVLTKVDTLKNGIEESPEKMIEKYMPQFYYTLSHIHNGERKYFSVFLRGADSNGVNQQQATQAPPTEQQATQAPPTEQQATQAPPTEQHTDVQQKQTTQESVLVKRIEEPVTYSSGEYVKFILWIVEKLS